MLFLSKLISLFVLPLGLIIVLSIAVFLSLVFNKHRMAKWLLVIQLLLIWLSSMPAFSDYLAATWEQKYLPVAIADSPTADIIVILGGAVEGVVPPRVEEDLGDGADRILHAMRLFKAGKAEKILVVGGNLPWLGVEVAEAEVIRSLLEEWGVPADAIHTSGESRNTYENAVEAKQVLGELGLSRVLLVTSALHMPRALSVFKTAGIDVTPSPTDFIAVDRGGYHIMAFVPDVAALSLTTSLAREWMGIAYYRWHGWLD
jgi:uncharacterized SAM-binding protein YcdF (DUF218 family)